ncbi:type IV pilus secretin PilQ family protein [Xylella taiwanensis]|uniref:Fimbrial protein n=1 Tax=Xylella taiwanensis TaxID=1444770 RepID=Z9JKC6_9GAMM|nr:type IV pilus secretin PilQ family protein [Xylella taiwanensis]EWS78865.1 fimbrial protein [Xylella taiwanensis]MCD8457303.1 type IV pilus secretin PilQ family protein [Xylella taiwanensis]MCD8459714.1 type IV pilus secretin PilQ family protein [Xylella taiwanensis]MCD8461416.1 type IV pilus secretin PilQ family protein [Xylella taiwanensis]MCD8462553.1 type IV pilus secretin PilQ family protein [Xylella taiwanensis]
MTLFEALSLRFVRRTASIRACAIGVGITLVWCWTAAAAPTEQHVMMPATKVANPSLSVSKIDFKRGDDGAGRLILQFDGQGASPDLRTQGSTVLVDLGTAVLPAALQQQINVVDFATPVQRIDAKPMGKGAQLVLSTKGSFESLAYQTGNEYVVEIVPRKGEAAMGGAITPESVSKSAAKISAQGYSGRPVTFNFQDVPVRTVLQLIADESNLNIVAADTVQGNVTLRLINVPWDQALDIVLRAKGLDKRRDDKVIWVAPQQELAKYEQEKEDARIAIENREGLITDYVQINYHSATTIFKALTEAKGMGSNSNNNNNDDAFLSPRGRLVADERTNTLMISDIPKKVAQMRTLIQHIDRPVDQVLIEGRIVIATDSFARDLGAKFGVGGASRFSDNTATIGSTVTAGGSTSATRGLNVDLGGATFSTAATLPSLAYTLLGPKFNLDLELSALQQESRGEVISNPRIVTANQREGYIKQGKEIGYVTITGGTAGGQATPNVQFKEAVLELRVTPTITNDNRVFLNMTVKKDEIDQMITIANFGTVPTLNKREINTAVLVDDGQTVVIGGVYEFADRNSVSKVPFLGDVPFLGNLFKKRGKDKQKAELLIFVTPKVLRVATAAR